MLNTILSLLGNLTGHEYLQNKYIISLLILVFAVLLAIIVLFVFNKYLNRLAEKTKNKFDDLIFDRTKKPIFYFILVYGVKLAVQNLTVGGIITKIVNSLMAFVFVLIILRAIELVIEGWALTFAKKTKTKIDDILLPLFQKVARVVLVIIALMWILRIWQIDITPYLAGAGIIGLVLGMALQDSMKNVFGGVTLILDKTYIVGDKVRIESGEVGTIHEIGLRSTKLITYDNEVIYIPNGYLANSRVQNYTRPNPKVRMKVNFGAEYGSDISIVKKTVLKVLNGDEGILKDPGPKVDFVEIGDSALLFEAKFWVEKWDLAYDKKIEMTELIYNALNTAKINIPFPTRTVYLHK